MSAGTLTSHPHEGAPALNGATLWLAAIMLATANFIAVLDMTIANVSVPNIAGDLGASNTQGTWVITSYAVAEAITVPLTGWIAGRFGSVRVFVTVMFGFGIFSALCGMASSLEMLVFFRILQGCCGGPLLPLSQTLLMKIFPKEKQPAALGLWAVTTLTAPILGPMLGGQLCDTYGWPSIFLINVPIALFCAPVLFKLLRSAETATAKLRVDAVGLGLLVVFVGSLQLMLDLGKEHDWFESPMIVRLGVIAFIGFIAFLIWELTEEQPIVNLRVFRHRGYTMSLITMSLAFGAFFASNVLTPLWLQTNMGYTATWAGYVTGMMGILALVGAPPTAMLLSRVDPRALIFTGISWLALAIYLRSQVNSDITATQIGLLMLFAGAGLPMFFMPLTGMALASVDPDETVGAAGLMNFVRTFTGAFATSIATTAWENSATRNQSELVTSMQSTQTTLDSLTARGMDPGQALGVVDQLVQGQSIMLATNQLFLGCALIFTLAAWVIWLAPKPTRTVAPGMGH